MSTGAREYAVIKVRVRLVGESVRPARAQLIHGAVAALCRCPTPPNVCSVVVCPHSAAERRQHAVRHGTCGLRLTQPVTSAARWCVHITPHPSLCEAGRSMRPPVQARCERFVLLPAGQPCEPIPSLQRPVAACVRAAAPLWVCCAVRVRGCNLAPKQRLCGQGSVGRVLRALRYPPLPCCSGRCGERPKRATGLSGTSPSTALHSRAAVDAWGVQRGVRISRAPR